MLKQVLCQFHMDFEWNWGLFEVSLCFNTIMSINTKIAFLDQTRFEVRLCSYMIFSTDISVSKITCGTNVVYSADTRNQRNEFGVLLKP